MRSGDSTRGLASPRLAVKADPGESNLPVTPVALLRHKSRRAQGRTKRQLRDVDVFFSDARRVSAEFQDTVNFATRDDFVAMNMCMSVSVCTRTCICVCNGCRPYTQALLYIRQGDVFN